MLAVVFRHLDRRDDRQAFVRRALGASHPASNRITLDQWGGHAETLADLLADALVLFARVPAAGDRHVVTALNHAVSDPKRPLHRNGEVEPHWRFLQGDYGSRSPFESGAA
jgi:hypothetical protein